VTYMTNSTRELCVDAAWPDVTCGLEVHHDSLVLWRYVQRNISSGIGFVHHRYRHFAVQQ